MSRCSMLLLLAVLLPSLAVAQITPLSQTRTVYCLAEADNGNGDGGSDEYFDEAVDFDLFDPVFSAEWLEDVAFSAAEVSQTSEILESSLVMQGDAFAAGQSVDGGWYAFATASSDFEVEFQVGGDGQFTLTGSTITQGTGYLDIELRDAQGAIFVELHLFESEFSSVEETGALPAGSYTMTVAALAEADASTVFLPATGISVFDLELAVTSDAIGVEDLVTADRYLTAAPNPMQGSTQIAYASDRFAPVTLDVLDVRGRRVRELTSSAANAGRVTWDGRDHRGQPVAQGLYFVRMRSGEDLLLRKVLVVR